MCVCVCMHACMCLCVCVCVCRQAGRSQARLSCDSSYYLVRYNPTAERIKKKNNMHVHEIMVTGA